mgnify:CR=1 FL=1
MAVADYVTTFEISDANVCLSTRKECCIREENINGNDVHPNGNIGTEESLEVLEKFGLHADVDKNKILAISRKLKKIITQKNQEIILYMLEGFQKKRE